MMIRALRLALAIVLAASTRVHAVVTVVRVPTGGTSASVTETFPGSGVWIVDLYTNVQSEPTYFTISGETSDAIQSVYVTTGSQIVQAVYIRIEGPAPSLPLAWVGSITMDTPNAWVIVDRLRTTGDVGTIRVHTLGRTGFNAIQIGGNLTNEIRLSARGTSGTSHLISAVVQGNILGDVIVDYGAILNLTVNGSIGTPSSIRTVRGDKWIDYIDAGSICANISTTDAAGGNIRRIRTTSGGFTGSLTSALGLWSTGSQQTDGLVVAGALDADVTIAAGVYEPITAASLPAGRTAPSAPRSATTGARGADASRSTAA